MLKLTSFVISVLVMAAPLANSPLRAQSNTDHPSEAKSEAVSKLINEIARLQGEIDATQNSVNKLTTEVASAKANAKWKYGVYGISTAALAGVSFWMFRIGFRNGGGMYDFSGLFKFGGAIAVLGAFGTGSMIYFTWDQLNDLEDNLDDASQQLSEAKKLLQAKQEALTALTDQ